MGLEGILKELFYMAPAFSSELSDFKTGVHLRSYLQSGNFVKFILDPLKTSWKAAVVELTL